MSHPRLFPLALAVASCAGPEASPAPARPPLASSQPAAVEGVSLPHRPDLRAAVTAPSRVPYVTESVGVAGQSVSIRLGNAAVAPVALGRLDVSFTATREGVGFPCSAPPVPDREPTTLGAGQSFVFERDLTCSMPLPGRYQVSVQVGPDLAGSFSLEVEGPRGAPRPYPARPGLFVVMTGSRVAPPLPAEAWKRGDYHVVVAFVNATREPMTVGPAHIAFQTYKVGSPLPCSGQADPLSLPEPLPPGGTRILQAPVACAPSEPGRYEIVGRFGLDGVPDEVEVGRVSLSVTRDPTLFRPELDVTLEGAAAGPDLPN